MAALLDVSASAYARLERNETSVDIETLTIFSRVLDVPLHEFLPETFQINNHNHNGQGGLVFGNFYYCTGGSEEIARLREENERLKEKLSKLNTKAGTG